MPRRQPPLGLAVINAVYHDMYYLDISKRARRRPSYTQTSLFFCFDFLAERMWVRVPKPIDHNHLIRTEHSVMMNGRQALFYGGYSGYGFSFSQLFSAFLNTDMTTPTSCGATKSMRIDIGLLTIKMESSMTKMFRAQ